MSDCGDGDTSFNVYPEVHATPIFALNVEAVNKPEVVLPSAPTADDYEPAVTQEQAVAVVDDIEYPYHTSSTKPSSYQGGTSKAQRSKLVSFLVLVFIIAVTVAVIASVVGRNNTNPMSAGSFATPFPTQPPVPPPVIAAPAAPTASPAPTAYGNRRPDCSKVDTRAYSAKRCDDNNCYEVYQGVSWVQCVCICGGPHHISFYTGGPPFGGQCIC